MKRVIWTKKEIRFLKKNHPTMRNKELAALLGKTMSQLNSKIIKLKIQKHKPAWTEKELEFLMDNYGRMSVDEISKKLKRSRNAIKIICDRKLHCLNQRSNIYTARATAEELGISDAKIIVAWHDRGFLKGQRAPFFYGKNQVWWFEYDDIVKCITERPWLCRRERMPEGYFRSIVNKEWTKNPWYNSKEAAIFLGLKDHNPIHRYIYHQLLAAQRRPVGGSKGEWIIRHKDLVEFQLHDPRPYHRKSIALPLTLENKIARIEKMAWTALSRSQFQRFGHYAGVWLHLNEMNGRKPPPFGELVDIAKKKV